MANASGLDFEQYLGALRLRHRFFDKFQGLTMMEDAVATHCSIQGD
jgi:hypothetical protein